MWVSEMDALGSVHILHFAEHVLVQSLITLDRKHFTGHQWTIGQSVTRIDIVAGVHHQGLALWCKYHLFQAFGLDNNGLLPLRRRVPDEPCQDLRENRGSLGSGLENFGHTGQTTHDVGTLGHILGLTATI